MHLNTPALEQCRQAKAIAVVDLPGGQQLARLAQFIATAEQAHPQRAMDFDPADPGSGQQAQLLGTQALAGLEQQLPLAYLLAGLAYMITEAHRR
ncbi:hypothetical protein D3C77_377660 [compost metagenome]